MGIANITNNILTDSGVATSTLVPTTRTLTINGVAFDLSADRSWTIATSGGTVTSVAALTLGTTGTDLSSTVATGTTTPVITLNVPTASAANRGALSAADWTTFNNKASTAALANYLPLAGGTMTGAIVGTTATFTNSGSGVALGVTQSGSAGDGILIGHSAGRALNLNSSGTGFGILINNDTAATSAPFTIQKSGLSVITLTDAGAGSFSSSLTASSFIRSGGTAAQFLKANGSIDSNTYLTTTSAAATYAPLTGTGTSGTWAISISGNAATASSATSAGTSTSTTFVSSPDGGRNPNTAPLPNTNPRSVSYNFAGIANITGATGNYAGVMTYSPWDGTSASTGDSSYQLAFCNFSGVNASGLPGLALRNGINSAWNATWYQMLHSGNYNSYSPTLTGTGASGTWGINITGNAATATSSTTAGTATNSTQLNGYAFTSYAYRLSGVGYYQINDWIAVNTNTGLYWPNHYGLHFYPNNDGSYGSAQILGDKNGWRGLHFGGGTGITLMMNEAEFGFHRQAVGWVARFTSGTGYFDISGSAGSVAWGNVSSKPSLIMYYQGFTLDANTMDGNSTGFTYSVNAPYTGPIARLSETGYSLQLNAAYGGGGTGIAFRTRNGDAGTFNPWRVILNDANYTSYSPSLTGSGASGTWAVRITGFANAGSQRLYSTDAAYNYDSANPYYGFLTYDGTYWHFKVSPATPDRVRVYRSDTSGTADNTNSISSAVGGNYNWTGLNYFVSNGNTPGNSFPLQAYSNNGSGAVMSFHRGGYYAVNFGLDSDNVMRIGGWSASANRWQLDMSGNQTVAGTMTSGLRITAGEDVYSNNGWFYSYNNAGWYNNTYGQGLRQAKGNVTFGNVINVGENFNGWAGYNAQNTLTTTFMTNSTGTHGFYQENGDLWTAFYNKPYQCWGLGTDATDPAYSLHIIKYGGSNTGWIIWSDRRIKENIKTIDNALDKVLSLRGVYYNKIDDPNKERCVGYIAQEVMEVVPELVVYSEELDMYNMNYGPMVGMLTEAIKEQQSQIETLKEQVQTLLNHINNGV